MDGENHSGDLGDGNQGGEGVGRLKLFYSKVENHWVVLKRGVK